MKLEDEIQLNKFGQDLVNVDNLLEAFKLLSAGEKERYLTDLVWLVQQSKAKKEDVDQAIIISRLKSTYTPCVLLKKEYSNSMLAKLTKLPDHEIEKVFILLVSLFKVSYSRRFEQEKSDKDKWWYWDLSDEKNIQLIRQQS